MILIAHVILGLLVGFGIGMAFFTHLRRAAFGAVRDGRAWTFAGGAMLRMSSAVLAFFMLTKLGAAVTLAGLAGFTVARVVIVAWKD